MSENTQAPAMGEDELDRAWDEEGTDLPDDGRDDLLSDQEEDTPDGERPDQTPADGELFTLKNRDEKRQVTRQELVAMAQKGWDYDNVRAERDQLRQYRQMADPTLTMVRLDAQRRGMTVGAYLDHCRRQDLERAGQDAPAAPAPGAALIRRFKQNARRQDMERFLQAYPGVKADSIPREVWGRVAKGVPLVSAYAMHENQQLRVQLAAEQQNRANRARTPGALGTSSGPELDEMDRMWAEED